MGNNKSSIESLCFSDEEQCVVSGAMSGSIKVFDLNVGKLARSLRGHQVNTCTLDYHPYGEFIVSGSSDTSMKVWDVRQKTCIQTYSGHEKEVTCVRFSPDGRWVASSGKDGQLLLWDLVAGKLLHSVRLQPTYIVSFEFNPAEFMLAAVTSAKTVRIWDLEVMKQIGCTYPDSQPIKGVAFNPNDSCLCTVTNDSAKIWHWEPVKMSSSVPVPWDGIRDMCISSTNVGTTLMAASANSSVVSLWSLDTEQMINDGITRAAKLNSRESVAGSSGSSSRNTSDGGGNMANRRNDVLLPTRSADPIITALPTAPPKIDGYRAPTLNSQELKLINGIGIEDLLDSTDVSSSGSKAQQSIPEMRWESEGAAKDMATSIGDSLWNKLSISRRNSESKQQGNERSRKELDSIMDARDERDSYDFADAKSTGTGVRGLESMLPSTSGFNNSGDSNSSHSSNGSSANSIGKSLRYKEDKEMGSKEEASHRELSSENINSRHTGVSATPSRQQELAQASTALRPSFPPKSSSSSSTSPGNVTGKAGSNSTPPSLNSNQPLSVVGTNRGGAVPAPRKDYIQQRHQNEFKQQFLDRAKDNAYPINQFQFL